MPFWLQATPPATTRQVAFSLVGLRPSGLGLRAKRYDPTGRPHKTTQQVGQSRSLSAEPQSTISYKYPFDGQPIIHWGCSNLGEVKDSNFSTRGRRLWIGLKALRFGSGGKAMIKAGKKQALRQSFM